MHNVTPKDSTEEQKALLSTVLEQSPLSVILTDRDGAILYVNEMFSRLTGYARDEIRGKNPRILKSGLTSASVYEQLWKNITAGTPWRGEFRNKKKNGELYWARADVFPITDQNGIVAFVAAFSEDISARKEALEILENSERNYEQLLELLPETVVIHQKGMLVYVNDAAIRMFGAKRPEDLLGKPVMDRVHPDSRDLVRRRVATMSEENLRVPFVEELFLKLDGTPFDAEVIAAPCRYQGQPAIQVIARDVSERNKMEAALAAERNLMRTILDLIPDAIYVKDREGRKTLVNIAESRLMGLSSTAEALGKTDFDIYPREQAERFWSEDLKLFEREEPILNSEGEILRTNGVPRWIVNSKVPLRDTSGAVVGIVGVSHDFTDRKAMEETIRTNELKYRSIFENAVEGFFQITLDGRLLSANPSLARILGYSAPSDLLKSGDHTAALASANASVIRKLKEDISNKGRISNAEMEIARNDGKKRWVAINMRVVRNSEAEDPYYEGTLVDIEKRRVAEIALEESQQQLYAIFESTDDLIWSVDTDQFSLQTFNGAWKQFCRSTYGVTLMHGLAPEEVYPAREAEVWKGFYRRSLQDGPFSLEHSPGVSDRVFLVSLNVLKRRGSNTGISVFAKEITERKKAEERIAESLAEKQVLLKEIHHRVKNNMQVIVSMLSMQKRTLSDGHLMDILSSCQERVMAMALVHERLYRSDDLVHIRFAEYLRALVDQVARTASNNNVRVECSSDETPLSIESAIPLGLIVSELLSNAMKYGFPENHRGTVVVSFTVSNDSVAIVTVADDGIGANIRSLDDLQKVRKGSIGLEIVRLLSEQLNGTLSVKNEGGLVFRLEFPIQKRR